ncbi:MAG: DUF3565 domain-containing protein [Myxococcales bacterium]|nr:DUF3565 domain-containing protein [Myxococcales bacterium]
MKRLVCRYRSDEEGYLVAVLDCGHGLHMRHRPPFELRPWTLTPEGRASRVGTEASCVRCDRFERPAEWVEYKRSQTFDAAGLPAALGRDHGLREGVWAELRVHSGALTLSACDATEGPWVLAAPSTMNIAPGWRHRVTLGPGCSFDLVFYRAPDATPAGEH